MYEMDLTEAVARVVAKQSNVAVVMEAITAGTVQNYRLPRIQNQ